VNKPAIITTNKPLPFAELSPDEFERMCLWLVDREGYERPQHLGEAGGEQGRDIVAYKSTESGKETWYFQCKRRNRITSTAFEKEVDKYRHLNSEDAGNRPTAIVFVTNAAVSAKIRDKVNAYCGKFGYECQFWARTELDLLVKKHKDIVREFFYAFADSTSRPPLLNPAPTILRMVEDYEVIFGGRDEEIAELNSFLESTEPNCALLMAPTGRGKTALLIHWIEKNTERNDWTIVFHPISRRYQTATPDVALGALTAALARFHGVSLEGYSTSTDQLRYLISDLLRREPPNGRKLLLVLDGLDETVGWQVDRTLFPRHIPEHVKLVASVRHVANRNAESWLDQLGWSHFTCSIIGLGLLGRAAISDLLSRCAPLEEGASDAQLVLELLRVSQGDPLTIRYLIESLQNAEVTLQQLPNIPPGIEAFVDYWLRDLEPQMALDERVFKFLGLLGAAVAPLASEDLTRIAPDAFSSSIVLREVARKVERFVVGDGSIEHGYVLSHPRLREIFFDRLSAEEKAKFADYFITDGLTYWGNNRSFPPTYVRTNWIRQLAEADAWELIRDVLVSFEVLDGVRVQPWCHIRFKSEGSYSGYLSDLDLLWDKSEEICDLPSFMRCAFISASLRSLSGNFAPELIADLVTVGTTQGRWPVSSALEHIRQVPDSRMQAWALEELTKATRDFSKGHVLDVIQAIQDEWYRSTAMEIISPPIAHTQMDQMKSILDQTHEPPAKVVGLCSFARHLAGIQRETILKEALAVAGAILDERSRIEALIKVAAQYPENSKLAIWEKALDCALRIPEDNMRWVALRSIARTLPHQLTPKLLQAIRSLSLTKNRAAIFVEMLDQLPLEAHDEVWRDTIEALSAPPGTNNDDTAKKLAQSSVHLSAELRDKLIDVAYSIQDPFGRCRALAALAVRADRDKQRVLWTDAATAARTVENPYMRTETSPKIGAWLDILPLMPDEFAKEFWPDALDASVGMLSHHHGFDFDLFCDLIDVLPTPFLTLSLEYARKDDIKKAYSHRLVHIGRRLKGEEQKKLLTEAVKTAQEIEDEHSIGEVIGAFGPYLQPHFALKTLEFVTGLGAPLSRFTAIQGLAQSVPENNRLDIWHQAFSNIKENQDPPSDHKTHWPTNDWSHWLAMREIISIVPLEILVDVLEIALKMAPSEARARTFTELAKRFSGKKALVLWHQVFNSSPYFESSLGEALSHVQPMLDPQIQQQQWQTFLETAIGIDKKFSRNRAVLGLIPYLPPSMLPTVLQFIRDLGRDDFDRVELLQTFITHAPEDLLPELLLAARDGDSPGERGRLLGAFAARLSDAESQRMLNEAMADLENGGSDVERYSALEVIAPNIAPSLLPRALQIALSISSAEFRARALVAFGPALPSELQFEALRSGTVVSNWSSRLQILSAVAPMLAKSQSDSTANLFNMWTETVRVLALYGRNELLQGIGALAPWLASFANPEDMDHLISGVLETRCSWA
jgi:Restriction endonuclease